MLHETFDFREAPVTLIHHAANCGHRHPNGSISALRDCLASGAAVVEIDAIPLADGSFALLHEQDLKDETNGDGNATQMTRPQVKDLFYLTNGKVSDEPYAPLTQKVLQKFLSIIKPVKARIQVTSVADWALRSLKNCAPDLALGFDPLLYLDIHEDQGEPRPENIPPFRVGAYGLRDDHPLSAFKWGSLGDYFAARAGALLIQPPTGCEWFIRSEVIEMALDAGFDWIDFLHQHGSTVDGWTIDVTQPDQIKWAQRLVEHGIDELTTDSPAQLAPHLHSNTII